MNLTEARQALRDQIWMAGPEHFDVSDYCTVTVDGFTTYPEPTPDIVDCQDWTACFAGYHDIVSIEHFYTEQLLGVERFVPFISVEGWHKVDIDGWNPGKAYDALYLASDGSVKADRLAQWHVAVEWLDRVIKRGE